MPNSPRENELEAHFPKDQCSVQKEVKAQGPTDQIDLTDQLDTTKLREEHVPGQTPAYVANGKECKKQS